MSDERRVSLAADEVSLPARHWARRLPLAGGVAGAAGVAASAILGRQDPAQLAFSWLVAFLFFLSLTLGAIFFVLLQYLARAGWSVAVRRVPEITMGTLPLFALLFLPVVLFFMDDLYPWARAGAAEGDRLLAAKAPYLNTGFFVVRALVYFAAWIAIGGIYLRLSLRQDRTGERDLTRRLNVWSGLGMVVFGLTVTFAGFDWIMSLDPHWYSTIFGVYVFSGSLVGFFAFLAVSLTALRGAGAFGRLVTTEHFHDVGKLLFAFTVFWSYIGFSQFFLIWYGNIPEETAFYVHRLRDSWRAVSVLLAVGHFGLPFLFFLPAGIKRRRSTLLAGAVWMLGMHLLDLHWLVMPNLHHDFHPALLDVTTIVGIGGFFVGAWGWLACRHALVPLEDPRLGESLAFENL